MGMLYTAEASDQLVTAGLGGIDAIYHRRGGATHLVAPPVPQILAALAQGPADLDGLLARLSARFDLGEDEADARAALAQRLDELAALGLVRREAG